MLKPTLPAMNFDIEPWSISASLQISYRLKAQSLTARRI